MSLLLERLGRPAGEPIQQKTIFGRRQAEAKEDNYQELKLAIHRRIVDEMSDQEQQFLSSNNHTRAEVEELIFPNRSGTAFAPGASSDLIPSPIITRCPVSL